MPNCDFNKVAKHGCSPVSLLHIFRKPFPKNTAGRLLLLGGPFPFDISVTALKVSKYGVMSGLYFPVFGLNTEICVKQNNHETFSVAFASLCVLVF